METILTLIIGGTLAGVINFFVQWFEFPLPTLQKLKDRGYIIIDCPPSDISRPLALLGYIIIGIGGSLTMYAVFDMIDKNIPEENYTLILLGYAIIFGIFGIKILTRAIDLIFPNKRIL